MPVVGTRLVREWHGERHEVTVTKDGLEYEGRPYRSLSAVAKVISGGHWSGPAFFGLRKPERKKRQDKVTLEAPSRGLLPARLH